MSAVYEAILPDVFPYAIDVPEAEARRWMEAFLAEDRQGRSSFAVTADTVAGHLRIWMSEMTMHHAERSGLIHPVVDYCDHSGMYYCPASGENECARCGGFGHCCEHPERHEAPRPELRH